MARLRHSWLENQILNKTADDVAHLWRLGRWEALDRQFANRVKEAMEVAERLEEGLSPAQLITLLHPLRELPGELQSYIGDAVRGALRKVYSTREFEEEIRVAADRLAMSVNELKSLWEQERSGQAEAVLRARWDDIQACGRDLLELLKSLPKGVVLP